MNKPFLCRFDLWHCWHGSGREEVMYPKCGPFDPRDDEQRTYERDMQVCCKCGDKREEPYADYPGL